LPGPISQIWTVSTYVLRQKLKGRKRYPLVLMLEPLFRCNLACAGCGKIQYPVHILKQQLTPEECFRAVDECGAPVVSIPGGEPLMHSEIEKIVEGLVARKKYIYLCTAAQRETGSIQAQQVPHFLSSHRWTTRAPRFFRLPRRWIRHCS
jgi:hopanoid biosynthesis associated radical SAM protein HpnH